MDRNVLYRFFAGTASYEEEEIVCDWADASEKNREELIQERKYFDVLLLRRAENSNTSKYGRPFGMSSLIRRSLSVAAAISVIIMSVIYVHNNIGKPTSVSAMNKIVVPPGQRVNVTLSDGTNVWLNACSELTYPVSFTEKSRSVSLKGEAYFNVIKDTEHPFVVQTKKCNIKVLGTEFNVQTEESDCEFSAALIKGAIELTDKTNPDSPIRLAPMQEAKWRNGKIEIGFIDNLNDYLWKDGLICFEDMCFTDLMKRFEKTYDIQIVIQNKNLHNYKCSGKCRVSDGVDYILQVLQRSTRFSFSRNESNDVIYIK